MRRIITIIFLSLISSIMMVSCIEEMQLEQPVFESDSLVLVPRVRSFANQYVTKSDYSELEKKISFLSVLVFGSDGDLLYLEESENSEPIIFDPLQIHSEQSDNLESATVVIIANISLADIKKGSTSIYDNIASLTLADMENYSCDLTNYATVVTDLTSGSFTGFPMIGGVKNVDLRPTSAQQAAIEVGLKILYAKVNFSIAVENGTENQNVGSGISFALIGYSVHNVSGATTLAIPTEKGEKVSDFLGYVAEDAVEATADEATASAIYKYKDGKGFSGTASGSTTVGGNAIPIPFTFYMAESRYNHNSDLKGIYPDNWLAESEEEDVKNYTSADQDKLNGVKYFYDDLIQQYKPKLAANSPDGLPSAGLATYVQIDGTYTDYRGTAWDVNYKVYLGKDNAHNFHVDRNSEYTNHITIKGIRNNDSYGEGQVWVDHRVNVNLDENSTNEASDCVTITRETLIDSHFEVRPLRVSLPDTVGRVLLYLPKYNGSQITETEDDVLQNWIAVENNNGRVKDITKYSQNGKRKYFTTSLIKELYLENNDEKYGIKVNAGKINDPDREGQKYISLFDGDCAWIYIDEKTTEGERTADIELVFYDTEGNIVSEEIFKLIQNGLTKVGDFYIEKYEEYLHTYDSQDLYTDPLTDYTQQGYKWGLNGIPLSKTQNVVLVGDSSSDTYFYDYFHKNDRDITKPLDGTYEVVGGDILKNVGLNFTNYAGVSQEMTIIDMDTRPLSAIQYCLSKNKFRVDESDEEAHTMDIHWYLPDVYEMTQILSGGEDIFPDFGEYSYWTSQPSWTTTTGLYLREDTGNARAVSLAAKEVAGDAYVGTNTPREDQQRIRCVYSPEGIDGVDFSGSRAPDGIGPMRFYMRAWKDWDTKEPGYFSWDGCLEDTETSEVIEYQLPDTYDFPKDADDANQYFGAFLEGYGFEEDPSDKQNWDTETVRYLYTSQVALNRWPGLTTSQVVTKNTVTGGETYYDLEGEKKETKGTITTYATDYAADITTSTLEHLDHLVDGADLSISFSKGDGTYAPIFDYYKENSVISKTITRSWVTPTYYGNNKVESEEKGPIYTPSGTVILTADEEATRIKRGGTLLTNEDGYIYPTEADAIEAGNAIVPSGAYNTTVVAEKSPTSFLGDIELYSYKGTLITRYYRAARYRYKVTYTLDGQTVTYYQYDNGGYWSEEPEKTVTTENNDPPTDQLIMYGGNSFTITANNNNEISSVKIYYGGSNVVDLMGTGRDYLRFTKDGFTGGKDEVPPGMTYSANGETGTMTWSGDPLTEVTFQLVLYRDAYDNIFGWGDPTSFSYIANTDASKGESIVIDQIDVRYKKKSTSSSE